MDEKNNQELTFDDILHQLTKPSIIQGQGQGMGVQVPTPSPSLPPSISRPPISGEVRLPSLGGESKSVSIQGIIPTPPVSQQNNTSLSIRTMAQDIERLKKGQKPVLLEVKRTIQPPQKQIPIPNPPPVPKEVGIDILKKAPIAPSLSRPSIPAPPSLPAQIQTLQMLPRIPKESSPTEYIQEQRHEEAVVGKMEDLLPEYLGAHVPEKTVKPVKENLQYSVIAKIIGSGMTAGIIITVIIAVAGYFLLSLFVFNAEEALPPPSPTPIPQITQTPDYNELETIFRDVGSVNFSLPTNQVETSTDLKAFIKKTEINKTEFKKINFVSFDNQTITLTFTDFMDRLSVRYPVLLRDVIRGENMTFMYGQGEILGEASSLPDPELANKRVVLVIELKDLAKATEILREWELTMSEDLKDVFNIDPDKSATLGFNDNAHRGVPIRYKNFPLPDRSIDYAIIHSLAGRQYLVITNSRESMYSPVEKITGL